MRLQQEPWLPAFVPGPGMTDRHDAVRLALSERGGDVPLPVLEAVLRESVRAGRYPDASASALVRELARLHRVPPAAVVVGNGIDELLLFCALAWLGPTRPGAVCSGSYPGHAAAVRAVRAPVAAVPPSGGRVDWRALAGELADAAVAFVCNPDNPTGTALPPDGLAALVSGAVRAGSTLVVDEAYIEYGEPDRARSALRHVRAGDPVVVLRTFSKVYGLAGLRCGYAIAPEPLADQLRRVKNVTVFNVNRLALAAAGAVLGVPGHVAAERAEVRGRMAWFTAAVNRLGWIRTRESATNFVFCRIDRDAEPAARELRRRGVLVRPCHDLGYPRHLRISIGTQREMESCLSALAELAPAHG